MDNEKTLIAEQIVFDLLDNQEILRNYMNIYLEHITRFNSNQLDHHTTIVEFTRSFEKYIMSLPKSKYTKISKFVLSKFSKYQFHFFLIDESIEEAEKNCPFDH